MHGHYVFFSKEEMACQHCDEEGMDDLFMERLVALRERLGFPLVVTSGYRCKDHPIEVAKAAPGAHCDGRAVDIAISGKRAYKLVAAALDMGFLGIGVKQKGNHAGRIIHLDIDFNNVNRPWIWSY